MNDKKSITKGSLVILVYFILEFFTTLPLYLLNISYSSLDINSKVIYLLIYNLFTISIIFLILNKEMLKDFKNFKNNFKYYFKKYIKYWPILLGSMILANIIVQAIYPGSSAGNEDSFRRNFAAAPIYSFLSACLYAPLIEEMVFRMGFKKIFKNKYLFIGISGLIFGGLHVIGNVNTNLDYLYLLPYCIPGFILAYVYYDSDNIFTSLGIHFIHNLALLILQIIL